jgi:hypothetical protein
MRAISGFPKKGNPNLGLQESPTAIPRSEPVKIEMHKISDSSELEFEKGELLNCESLPRESSRILSSLEVFPGLALARFCLSRHVPWSCFSREYGRIKEPNGFPKRLHHLDGLDDVSRLLHETAF